MERGQRNLGEGPPPSPLLQGTHDCRVDVETEDPDEEERVSAGGIYLNPRILQALQGCSDTNVVTSRKANMIVGESPLFCLRFLSACRSNCTSTFSRSSFSRFSFSRSQGCITRMKIGPKLDHPHHIIQRHSRQVEEFSSVSTFRIL